MSGSAYKKVKPRRGAPTFESGTRMCCSNNHLFSGHSTLPNLPIYHQHASHVLPFAVLQKFSIFSLVFGQIFSSQDAIFHSQHPLLFKGKSKLLETCAAHIHQKKLCTSIPPNPRGKVQTTLSLESRRKPGRNSEQLL